MVVLTGLRVTGLQVRGYVFRQLSLPSIRGRANGVPFPSRLFVRFTVSPVEAPKVTHVSVMNVTGT